MNKQSFIEKCIRNRKTLELSTKDMAKYLNISEKEYMDFENGNGNITKENFEKIIRILCVENKEDFSLEKYIDTADLNDEEIADLKDIVETIVGDDNA